VSASDDRDNRWTWQGAAVEFRVPERSGRLEQTPLEARTRVMDRVSSPVASPFRQRSLQNSNPSSSTNSTA